ncbi:MAG TPA: arginine--tRNA ligase [Bacteroidales bacterium]
MSIENLITRGVKEAVFALYHSEVNDGMVQLQETRKEFIGDLTLVTFPFLKLSRKSPELTGTEIGNYLKEHLTEIEDFSVIKGFLNLVISRNYWLSFLAEISDDLRFGMEQPESSGHKVMVEYSSPNTNKPLHLGHIRNNLLGFSISNILKANGHKVTMVNLVNDRGIHICKSMLAWKKWGEGKTPQSTGMKGDHLVGDFYVKFDLEYKKQIKELIGKGMSETDAEKNASLIKEAQEMLRQWEAKDPEVVALWEMMNNWVYAGFDETYKHMGVKFDRIYHESQTYLLGKAIVQKGLEQGILFSKPDNSVWADLTKDGLDEKLLLRSDGTSVYMTQDLGTACQRFDEYHVDEMVYVVGNEQNYHFQVLALILQKLGYSWASQLKHMSYGMVELPSGKMKSREGTVVDADDLIEEMIDTAREMSAELGKLEGFSTEQAENIFRIIGLGALKYFILKVDPKKNMLFDPKESIDFNGNTGPFIQYTYARIQSVIRKAADAGINIVKELKIDINIDDKEKQLIKLIYRYPSVVKEAGTNLSPALIANYVYELAKEYNQFYHDYTIIKEKNKDIRDIRMTLSKVTSDIIQSAMELLGIEVPERM